MINGKTVLAIIPARGGSKGIPNKNLISLGGKPLIDWTIEAAKQSKYIDRLILSSDSQSIIDHAVSVGCEAPFVRPAELAQDDTPGMAPVLHAIESLDKRYDLVVLLQPTSPLRETIDIDTAIEKCYTSGHACVSVTEPDKSPYWMYTLSEDNRMHPLLKSDAMRRQDLPKAYALNGAVYVASTAFLLENKSFITDKTVASIMPKLRSADIDDKMDLQWAELLLKKR
jgi:N-acylneuraminate cytidylyltransferase